MGFSEVDPESLYWFLNFEFCDVIPPIWREKEQGERINSKQTC